MLQQVTGIRGLPIAISYMLENAGPLALLDRPQERFNWFQSIGFDIHLYKGFVDDGPEALVAQWQAFWVRIDDWAGPVVIWFSSQGASDQSLVLALVNRIGGARPVALIDVAEPVERRGGISGVGGLSPEDLQLWIPSAQALTETRLQSLRAEYAAFAAVPDALRVFTEGRLTGAPVDGLDGRILSRVTAEWTPLARACATTPGAFGNGGYRDLEYSWMLWRVDELQRLGRIERRGGAFDASFEDDPLAGEVRLAG